MRDHFGQIKATSHDLTPKGSLVGEIPYSGFSRLVNYYNLARSFNPFWGEETRQCMVNLKDFPVILLMEEMPNNHLGFIKPCK